MIQKKVHGSISLARAISLLVMALTSNDFKESLTLFQLIVIIRIEMT